MSAEQWKRHGSQEGSSLIEAELIGIPAGIVSTAIGMPQLIKLFSRRDAAGVSVATWWLTALSGLTWVIHNVRHQQTAAAVTNGWSAAVAVAILYHCYGAGRPPRRGELLFLGTTVVTGLLVLLTAPDQLGWVAAAIGIVQFGPQAWMVLAARDLSGVSTSTWLLAVAAAVLWMTYGVLHGDPSIAIPPMVTGSLSLVIACRVLLSRGTREPMGGATSRRQSRPAGG